MAKTLDAPAHLTAEELSALKAEGQSYEMRISRLTVDKLGVKLYDAVSAVVAELVANGYDADAESVTIRVPLNTLLARKMEQGVDDGGYVVEVEDDGHGMTPLEAMRDFLEVGRDRRSHGEQGTTSRDKKRPVMGRKGIGKLAPFGICRRIEVLSAGGPKTEEGFLVTHFFMDYVKIVADADEPVVLEAGTEDRTFRPKSGTTIRLQAFLPKRVPDAETFHRQLAKRFAFARPDFKIVVEDTRNPTENPPKKVEPLSIPLLDHTRVDLNNRPVRTEEGSELPVTGWLGLAKEAYKNEEMTGVRIYARGKIVAVTRDFEQPAGYTGEFTMRSYLVGEVHAEWLDLDEGDDLVRTDRQGIVWDSEYGRALRSWGAALIKEIGANARTPRRTRVSKMFLDKAKIEERANAAYAENKEIVEVAVDLAKKIGGFAAEDELEDGDYINGLCDIILAVAPHKALIQAFQRFHERVAGGTASLDDLLSLFNKTRIAEMASYSQIAAERVRIIKELEQTIYNSKEEAKLQALLADAPWLIEPSWSVISKNQTLKTFKSAFERFWQSRTGEELTLAIGAETKRPDFTLVNVGHMLHIVEIKASGHVFTDADFERMLAYVDAFIEFFAANPNFNTEFSVGWRIDLVADGVRFSKSNNKHAYEKLESERRVLRTTWVDFLSHARVAHELFLEVSDEAQKLLGSEANTVPIVQAAPAKRPPAPATRQRQSQERRNGSRRRGRRGKGKRG